MHASRLYPLQAKYTRHPLHCKATFIGTYMQVHMVHCCLLFRCCLAWQRAWFVQVTTALALFSTSHLALHCAGWQLEAEQLSSIVQQLCSAAPDMLHDEAFDHSTGQQLCYTAHPVKNEDGSTSQELNNHSTNQGPGCGYQVGKKAACAILVLRSILGQVQLSVLDQQVSGCSGAWPAGLASMGAACTCTCCSMLWLLL